jgi:hypothetical protein
MRVVETTARGNKPVLGQNRDQTLGRRRSSVLRGNRRSPLASAFSTMSTLKLRATFVLIKPSARRSQGPCIQSTNPRSMQSNKLRFFALGVRQVEHWRFSRAGGVANPSVMVECDLQRCPGQIWGHGFTYLFADVNGTIEWGQDEHRGKVMGSCLREARRVLRGRLAGEAAIETERLRMIFRQRQIAMWKRHQSAPDNSTEPVTSKARN